MKKTLIIVYLIFCVNLYADQYVNGYSKSNGIYVKGHYKSSSNYTKNDNWTTKGNKNPYTYEKGTKSYKNSFNYKRYGKTK
ncbi:hypothetical protein AAHK07_10900 [Aliarcobacter cryaerophilus]|uniref:hypothetical protein n=1 Tax=Aliarcobacter cryaerophilus TaxID=28198 RepID=UPI0031771502